MPLLRVPLTDNCNQCYLTITVASQKKVPVVTYFTVQRSRNIKLRFTDLYFVLTDAVKEGSPENIDLERLAYQNINDWKTLGRRLLENDEALLNAVDKDNDEFPEKAYKMLLK